MVNFIDINAELVTPMTPNHLNFVHQFPTTRIYPMSLKLGKYQRTQVNLVHILGAKLEKPRSQAQVMEILESCGNIFRHCDGYAELCNGLYIVQNPVLWWRFDTIGVARRR